MLGPIDYIVIGFKGNSFDGSIMRELSSAVDKGIIRVVDLVFIMKNEDGTVVEGEYEEQTDELKDTFGNFDFEGDMPLLTEGDIAKIGEQMGNNTAAGVLVIEHLWAKSLKKALIHAGGYLIADGRIHPEIVAAALDELQTTAKS